MKKPSSTAGDIDGLPGHYLLTHDSNTDRSWWRFARCASSPGAWFGDADASSKAMALKVCATCPAQWECARGAVARKEGSWGHTYAMPPDDLLWLQRQPDADEILQLAGGSSTPVQIVVRDVRAARQPHHDMVAS